MNTAVLKTPVLKALARLLHPLGYRKTGPVFSLNLGEVIHLVEVQTSRQSTANEVKLTVNLGVFVPGLVYADIRDITKPSIPLSQWRQRIGALLPEQADTWWSISSSEQAVEVATEISSRIENYGLAALASVQSMSALAAIWGSGRSPGLTERQRQELLVRLKEALSTKKHC